MPSVRHWAFFALALSLLTACTGPDTLPALSTSALSDPCEAPADRRLIGAWYWADEYQYYLDILPRPDICGVTVFGYRTASGDVTHWIKAEAYPTMLDGRTYYNVRLLVDAEQLYGLPEAPDGYLIAEFEFPNDGRLSIRLVGFSTSSYADAWEEKHGHYVINKLVEAGRIKARLLAPDNAIAPYNVLEHSRGELLGLFNSIPPELLMSEWQGPFLRLDRPGAVP